jgi:flagellar biosynthesis chaperone FliJ
MTERDEQQSIKELEDQVIDLLNRLNASPEHVWTSDGYMTKDDYIAKLEKRILELATENAELKNAIEDAVLYWQDSDWRKRLIEVYADDMSDLGLPDD